MMVKWFRNTNYINTFHFLHADKTVVD